MPTHLEYREVYLAKDEPCEVPHENGAVVTVLSAEHSGGGAEKPVLVRFVVATTTQAESKKR